jgi:hypothetical protein
MCANQTTSALILPVPAPSRWSLVLRAAVVVTEAFQEALEMRREAARRFPFRDE